MGRLEPDRESGLCQRILDRCYSDQHTNARSHFWRDQNGIYNNWRCLGLLYDHLTGWGTIGYVLCAPISGHSNTKPCFIYYAYGWNHSTPTFISTSYPG